MKRKTVPVLSNSFEKNSLLLAALLIVAFVFIGAAGADAREIVLAEVRSAEESFRVVSLAEGLQNPWSVVFLPDGRLLVSERPGRLNLLENGRVVLDGSSDTLRENEDLREFYLGLSKVGERKSYREVKHYRRRKRWIG